jgi:hypothetical protein
MWIARGLPGALLDNLLVQNATEPPIVVLDPFVGDINISSNLTAMTAKSGKFPSRSRMPGFSLLLLSSLTGSWKKKV